MHAKWVFLVLAICFALGFVIFGVGSGSTGISDALQNAFNFGSSGTSISSLEKKVAKNPQDATAWRSLATAYETKQRTADAINALERFTALRPKNADALGELASQYVLIDQQYYTDYQNGLAASSVAAPSSQFQLSTTSRSGRPSARRNPRARSTPPSSPSSRRQIQTLASNLTTEENLTVSTYQRLAKLQPKDATTQLQLGQAAEAAGNNAVAIAAFKKFLKLAPTDLAGADGQEGPEAAAVANRRRRLTASAGSAVPLDSSPSRPRAASSAGEP